MQEEREAASEEHDLTERGSDHALHGGIGFGPRGGRAQPHYKSDSPQDVCLAVLLIRSLIRLLQAPERFDALACELSNCPSGQQGGNLGQISRGDTVPEFERALFRLGPTGILREVVRTRHGFHIVAVDQRIPGKTLPFEAVQEQIGVRLKTRVEQRALGQYVSILAGQAEIVGVDLRGSQTPLVQ